MGGVSVRTEIGDDDGVALFTGAFVNRKQLKAEIQQAISELLMQAAGPLGVASVPEDTSAAAELELASLLTAHYLNYRKVTIYGGSNEIQRNIVAKMILGF